MWSKLAQPDGRNNYPWCFPENEKLTQNFKNLLAEKFNVVLEGENVGKIEEMAIYKDGGTRVGVW